MQEERGRTMCDALGVHALEEANVIDVLGNVWEQTGNRLATLAVALEIPHVLQDLLRSG